ncbi:MAG: hypothetical protein PHV85_04200 [Desulfovibrionaceae bacterium]|nr:hypothetical protein [Desulfovibrionaceae bacterium]MDD4951730.1 hypothetical protein [Desulfovibrionaceae bacterium]
MSKAWIRAKLPEFVRDLFRNFCLSCRLLEEQFRQFETEGLLSHQVLRDLLGQEMNKGLLWRLKDTAHHVFRNAPAPLEGRLLDWGMGYIFHETVKLLEDSYQHMNYAPWFRELQAGDLPQAEKDIASELYQVLEQTRESIRREIARIRFIAAKCKQLLPTYLARHRDNMLLARLIYSQEALVKEVFFDEYEDLILMVYGGKKALMHVLASRSLRLGGWMKEAGEAVSKALKICPEYELALQEKKIIDNWSKRIKT